MMRRFDNVKLYKPPGGKTYCFKIPSYLKPDKRNFNTRESNKNNAERVRDNYLNQLEVKVNNQTFTEAYLDRAIEAFMDSKAGSARKTILKYKATTLEFQGFVLLRMGKIPRMQDIDKPTVEAYLKSILDKGLNPHTRNDKRNIIASLFNYAVDNDWLVKSVVKKIGKIEEPESAHPDPHTEEEVNSVLDECKNMKQSKQYPIKCYFEIMAIIYYAGLRISEVTHLCLDDIAFNERRILVRNKTINYGDIEEEYRTKTKRNWHPPINLVLEIILKNWLKERPKINSPLLFPNANGRPMDEDSIAKLMRKAMKRLGFAPDRINHPLHRGRHTFTSISRKGVDEPLVQGALGHKTNIMTRHYTHLSPDFIADKFNKVSYGQNKDGEDNEK